MEEPSGHIPTLYFTLKMGTACFSETLVSYHITARHHKPEACDMSLHRCGNLSSHLGRSEADGLH